MSSELEASRVEHATEIRNKYNSALSSSYRIYCDSEDVAAFLALDLRRLRKSTDEKDREKIAEKEELLGRVKENLLFILEKMLSLSKEKNEFLSDIYTSSKIVDVENDLTDLTPWLNDLSMEIEAQATEARTTAKITSEVNHMLRA